MDEAKILSLMGLARRAGKLQMGNDPVRDSLRCGKARLLVLAGDISQRTARGLRAAAQTAGVPCLVLTGGMERMAAAIGRRSGAAAVEDAGFADRMRALARADEEECN